MILVDTSVWIDFLKHYPSPEAQALRNFLERDELLAITGLIYAEILQGIRDRKMVERVKRDLSVLTILDPSGLPAYEAAAGLYHACRVRGVTLRSMVDCVIAAVAIENRIPILHKDLDFSQIAKYSELEVCAPLRT